VKGIVVVEVYVHSPEGNKMKIHCEKKHAGLMIFTKCGLLFWPEVNNYYTYDVVVCDEKKVTCKNCLKIINNRKG